MEVSSPGQGVNGHPPPSATSLTIDPDVVIRHLVDLLEITLGASSDDLEAEGCLLSDDRRQDTVQRCTRFACEPQVALYVQKEILSIDVKKELANGRNSTGKTSFSMS